MSTCCRYVHAGNKITRIIGAMSPTSAPSLARQRALARPPSQAPSDHLARWAAARDRGAAGHAGAVPASADGCRRADRQDRPAAVSRPRGRPRRRQVRQALAEYGMVNGCGLLSPGPGIRSSRRACRLARNGASVRASLSQSRHSRSRPLVNRARARWNDPSMDPSATGNLYDQMLANPMTFARRPQGVLSRIVPDRRRHKRISVTLLGRFMRESKEEHPASSSISRPAGQRSMSPVAVPHRASAWSPTSITSAASKARSCASSTAALPSRSTPRSTSARSWRHS